MGKRWLLALPVIVVIALVVIGYQRLDSQLVVEPGTTALDTDKFNSTTQPTANVAAVSSSIQPNQSGSNTDHNDEHGEAELAFEDLPAEIQTEVRRLSSKDNRDLVVTEYPDGSGSVDFRGVHASVPVAVLNEDGTVTIKEF